MWPSTSLPYCTNKAPDHLFKQGSLTSRPGLRCKEAYQFKKNSS